MGEVWKKVKPAYGTAQPIADALGVTKEFVSKACAGKSDTDLAQRVRYIAVREFGATPLDGNSREHVQWDGLHYGVPFKCEYKWNGDRVYRIGNRGKIVYEKEAGIVGVFIDGKLKRKENAEMSIPEFMELLEETCRSVGKLENIQQD